MRPDSQVNSPGLAAEPSTGNVEGLQNPAVVVDSHGSGGASDLADQVSTAVVRTVQRILYRRRQITWGLPLPFPGLYGEVDP